MASVCDIVGSPKRTQADNPETEIMLSKKDEAQLERMAFNPANQAMRKAARRVFETMTGRKLGTSRSPSTTGET